MQEILNDQIRNFNTTFTSIVFEALPFVVLGALIAGILEEMVPQQMMTRYLGKGRFVPILMGAVLGLAFPMCECGIIPIMRRLLRKGLPLSCCVSYLLAGPIINGIVILSTITAFTTSGEQLPPEKVGYQMNEWWMAGLRVGLAFLVAVVTGLIVERVWQRHGPTLLTELAQPTPGSDNDDPTRAPRSPWQRISSIAETALHDCVDIMVFLILGALLAAGIKTFLISEAMIVQWSGGNRPVAILVMMGFAVILCLCSEADAFVAASFSTMHPAAKLAFLVLGPMLDIKLLVLYTRVFRPRLILTIVSSVVTQVFVYTLAVALLWDNYHDGGWVYTSLQGLRGFLPGTE